MYYVCAQCCAYRDVTFPSNSIVGLALPSVCVFHTVLLPDMDLVKLVIHLLALGPLSNFYFPIAYSILSIVET